MSRQHIPSKPIKQLSADQRRQLDWLHRCGTQLEWKASDISWQPYKPQTQRPSYYTEITFRIKPDALD